MKNCYFILILILLTSISFANAEELLWNNTYGGTNHGRSIDVEDGGNAYVVGVSDHGNTYLLKYDTEGNLLWDTSFEYPSSRVVYKTFRGSFVKVDGNGNAYVLCSLFSENTGDTDVFVLKYDNNGNLLWNISYGNSPWDEGSFIAIDGNGNAYVLGYNGTAGTSDEIFILKYDTEGNLLWDNYYDYASCYYIDYSNVGTGLAIDGNGNAYVLGYGYSGLERATDILVLKYDTEGNLLWNTSFDYKTVMDFGRDIAIDGNGNAYVLGQGFTGPYSTNQDILVLKYDTEGNLLWNHSYDQSFSDFGNALAIDGNGNAYVLGLSSGGVTSHDILFLKYDTNGNLLWNTSFDYNSYQDYGSGITVDGSGNSYIVGGGYTGVYYDILFLKYDTNGNLLWNSSYYDGSSEYAPEIDIDDSENAYIVGTTCASGYNLLILKYGSSTENITSSNATTNVSLISGNIYESDIWTNTPNGTFSIVVITDTDGSLFGDNPVINKGDIVAIAINSSDSNICARKTITGRLMVESGVQKAFSFNTPTIFNQPIINLY